MGGDQKFSRCVVVLFLNVLLLLVGLVSGIGVNWGVQSTHPLSPSKVVKMLKDNGIQKVKLFDADPSILSALKKSGIQVMVGIPNDMLYTLANSVQAAEKWVSKNVSAHVSSGGVDIRYIYRHLFFFSIKIGFGLMLDLITSITDIVFKHHSSQLYQLGIRCC